MISETDSAAMARKLHLPADWDKAKDKFSPDTGAGFARCGCGAIEHLLMGEVASGFRCCVCREARVDLIIASRCREAA